MKYLKIIINIFVCALLAPSYSYSSAPANHPENVKAATVQANSAAATPAIVLASGKKVVQKKVDNKKALEEALFADDASENKQKEDKRRVTVAELADDVYERLQDDLELDECIGGNGKNRNIQKALQVFKTAAIKNDTDMLHVLLDNNYIDLTDEDEHENTPLHIAADECCSDFIKIICEHEHCDSDDIDAKNDYHETPLFVAVVRKDLASALILLDHEADTQIVTTKGYTVLLQSVFDNDPDMTQALLDFGADVTQSTRHCGRTSNALQDAEIALERNWLYCYKNQSEGQKRSNNEQIIGKLKKAEKCALTQEAQKKSQETKQAKEAVHKAQIELKALLKKDKKTQSSASSAPAATKPNKNKLKAKQANLAQKKEQKEKEAKQAAAEKAREEKEKRDALALEKKRKEDEEYEKERQEFAEKLEAEKKVKSEQKQKNKNDAAHMIAELRERQYAKQLRAQKIQAITGFTHNMLQERKQKEYEIKINEFKTKQVQRLKTKAVNSLKDNAARMVARKKKTVAHMKKMLASDYDELAREIFSQGSET